MAVTNFDTINGKIMGQHSVAVDGTYFIDPLGSVVAAKVNKNAVVNTTYTPLGLGTAPGGVTFGWVGGWGYRRTNGPSGLDHVRHRHMPKQESRWLGVDLMWPSELPYTYVHGNALSYMDSSGRNYMNPIQVLCNKKPTPQMPYLPVSCTNAWNKYIFYYCNCISSGDTCDAMASSYYDACQLHPRPGMPPKPPRPIRPPLFSGGIGPPLIPPPDVFAPPVHGGEVSPRPRPRPTAPPDRPCTPVAAPGKPNPPGVGSGGNVPEDCWQEWDDCANNCGTPCDVCSSGNPATWVLYGCALLYDFCMTKYLACQIRNHVP
jgi:hypothetical protein